MKAGPQDKVTYGTKPALFLSVCAMHQLSMDEEINFPIGSRILRRDFYVEDLISRDDSILNPTAAILASEA